MVVEIVKWKVTTTETYTIRNFTVNSYVIEVTPKPHKQPIHTNKRTHITLIHRYMKKYIDAHSFFQAHGIFGQVIMCLKMCLNKTTKAFMCLKSVPLPVLTWPNLAVKAFYVLIFFSKQPISFLTAKTL